MLSEADNVLLTRTGPNTPMGNLFRLTELTTGPLWVLDGTAATPRTVFVPARVE